MIEKPTKSSDLQSQAREEHLNGNSSKAILLLTEAIQEDSSNLDVAMDMVQVFLDIDELEQAISLFSKFPDTIVETSMPLSTGLGRRESRPDSGRSAPTSRSNDLRPDLTVPLSRRVS